MYNLIVMPNKYTWSGEYADLDYSRFLEHTDSVVKDKFQDLDEKTIAYICTLPTVFASEMGTARIGTVDRIIVRRNKVRFFYVFDDRFNDFNITQFTALDMDFDTHKLEASRTHWAIKDVDLFDGLKMSGLGQHKKVPSKEESSENIEVSSDPILPTAKSVTLVSFLRDPVWQSVGVFVAIIAVVIAVL